MLARIFVVAPVVAALAAAPASARLLVVPATGAEAAVVNSGVRGALADAGIDAADEATCVSTVADASAAGFACKATDGVCWFRVAELGGFDAVVFTDATSVGYVDGRGGNTSPVFGGDTAAWAAGLRRALKRESALRVSVSPADATVTVDGVAWDPQQVGKVAPGAHQLNVSKPGFVPQLVAVDVAAGAVGDASVTLVEAPASFPVLPVAVAASGAVVGTAVIIAGQAAIGCLEANCSITKEEKALGDSFALVGIGIVVAGVVGGAVLWAVD